MRRRRVYFVVAALIAICGLLAAWKFFGKSELQILQRETVTPCDIDSYIVETGIIKPRVGALVKVGARATGAIERMLVKVGDAVKRGQLIALIDSREINREIRQTEWQLEAARDRLRQINEVYPRKIDEAKARLTASAAQYRLAELNLGRTEELFRAGFISETEYDTRKTSFDAAAAEKEISERVIERTQREYETERDIATSEIERLQSTTKQQEIQRSYTKIIAPIDGVVAEITAQEGETIVAGLQVANLISILDPTLLEMHTFIDETEIGRIIRGQEVHYYVDTYPQKSFQAVVDDIYPQPTVKDNIVYYLAISNVPVADAEYLRSQMTTHVKILVDTRRGVLCVPNSAVKYESGRRFVYRVKGKDSVERVFFEAGLRGEETTEVRAGLADGDVVATRLIVPVDLDRLKNSGAK